MELTLHAVLQVLDRLGTLHLVRHAVTQQMPQPDPAFNLGPAHAPMSRHLKVTSICLFMFNVLALLSRHVSTPQKAVLHQILGAQPPAVHSLVMQPIHIRKLLTAKGLFIFVRACQVDMQSA